MLLDAGTPQLKPLLEEARRLMAERDPAALLRHACEAARRMTHASVVAVAIVGDDGAIDDFVAVGLEEATAAELRRTVESNHDHPARDAFEARRVVRGLNPGGDPSALCLPRSHPPVHSYVFVPVASPTRVHGWLALLEKSNDQVFSDEDSELGSTFGELAGMAYDNARLLAQLQAQAAELRDHEEQTVFAMSVARTGVLYRDLDSPWIEVSRSATELFGLPADSRRVTPEDLLKGVHEDDAAQIRAALDKAIEERSGFALEFRRIVEDEGVRWFQFRGRVVNNAQSEAWRIVGVVTDITERRQLGIQLRQSQKMEALGQLAGGVAHDFNNLLTAIMGYARFALESAGDASLRHHLDEITKAAGRASMLTKQLLAFSRGHVVETALLDLNVLAAGIVTELRRRLGAGAQLATSLATAPLYVRADRGHLEQVVKNLVVNAREAAGPGGHVRLATAAADVDQSLADRVSGLTPGSYAALSVTDDGPGMDETVKSRLFEPFFTTKPRGQGTGLGLATVYGIVINSGGGIHVESESGRGSTFTVYFPRERDVTLSAGRSTDSPARMAARTVLLVEDEEPVRELVRMILERAGHRVVEAADAEEAMRRFETMPSVDLLLTDVVMPGMSGFDLFHALVQRLPSLRVLFISGYTDYARLEPAIAGPDASFLEKPFSAEALTRKVRELLSD